MVLGFNYGRLKLAINFTMYLPVLKIHGKIYGKFWVAIYQAMIKAQDHKIWIFWLQVGCL